MLSEFLYSLWRSVPALLPPGHHSFHHPVDKWASGCIPSPQMEVKSAFPQLAGSFITHSIYTGLESHFQQHYFFSLAHFCLFSQFPLPTTILVNYPTGSSQQNKEATVQRHAVTKTPCVHATYTVVCVWTCTWSKYSQLINCDNRNSCKSKTRKASSAFILGFAGHTGCSNYSILS